MTFSRIIREPVVQFLLIGAAIFLVAEFAADWKEQHQRTIVIDDGLEDYLQNLYSVQFGVNPDTETLDRLIENYINDEVMYREALRMGLAERDEIIRRRLVQKMEYLITDSGDMVEPEEAILKRWYAQHATDYTRSAKVTFDHLYFSNDAKEYYGARQRALETLELIQAGQIRIEQVKSDPFPLKSHYWGLSRRDAQQVFGNTEIVHGLFQCREGQWCGPFQSGYGWHLLLVTGRTEAELAPFSEISEKVSSDWKDDYRKREFDLALRNLRHKYEVRRSAKSGME